MDKFRQFGSIISVTTDAILARCMSSPQLGREPEPQVFFLRPMKGISRRGAKIVSDNSTWAFHNFQFSPRERWMFSGMTQCNS
jgi:hypothetical protein